MTFNPFEDRLCRDVRNNLAKTFIEAVETCSSNPLRALADHYLEQYPLAHIRAYVCHREVCLNNLLQEIQVSPPVDDDFISVHLWNQQLFFEFHEWLEKQWVAASGSHRKALQALILSAVVYEQLKYSRPLPAEKVALKAVKLFTQHREFIPKPFDTDIMILKLAQLDPAAPQFGC